MNVLRIWGEAHEPPREFYEQGDRRGIPIWRDFLFGYGLHPSGQTDFNENCRTLGTEEGPDGLGPIGRRAVSPLEKADAQSVIREEVEASGALRRLLERTPDGTAQIE